MLSTLQPEVKKSGWSKLMGSLSGMSPFFSSRMKDFGQATMARVVYHAIVKQHVAVAAEMYQSRAPVAPSVSAFPTPPVPTAQPFVLASEAPEVDLPEVEEPAPLAEQVEIQQDSRRRIKLDL